LFSGKKKGYLKLCAANTYRGFLFIFFLLFAVHNTHLWLKRKKRNNGAKVREGEIKQS
jgi:hypothetical protein